jgi:hypothetical protein
VTDIDTEPVTIPVWIDPSIFSSEPWGDKEPVSNDGIARLYEVHQHACDRLANNPDGFDRVDAIMALRRAVGRRVKELKEIYQLRELPTGVKPKGDLELLEYFGIIRPFMLRRLIDIRNFVEHQDSDPPSPDECRMFADLVWYFLRSTDGLAKFEVQLVIFHPHVAASGNLEQIIQLHFREPFSEPEISALVLPSLIAYEPQENWVAVEQAKISPHNHGDETIWVSVKGKVRGADEQMKLIYDLYFRASY